MVPIARCGHPCRAPQETGQTGTRAVRSNSSECTNRVRRRPVARRRGKARHCAALFFYSVWRLRVCMHACMRVCDDDDDCDCVCSVCMRAQEGTCMHVDCVCVCVCVCTRTHTHYMNYMHTCAASSRCSCGQRVTVFGRSVTVEHVPWRRQAAHWQGCARTSQAAMDTSVCSERRARVYVARTGGYAWWCGSSCQQQQQRVHAYAYDGCSATGPVHGRCWAGRLQSCRAVGQPRIINRPLNGLRRHHVRMPKRRQPRGSTPPGGGGRGSAKG